MTFPPTFSILSWQCVQHCYVIDLGKPCVSKCDAFGEPFAFKTDTVGSRPSVTQ